MFGKILFSFVLVLSFTQVDQAQARDLSIGVESLDYLPFYSGKGRTGYSGYARELFDQYAKDKGHNITYVLLPVSSLFDKFKAKKFDFKFPDNPMWRKADRAAGEFIYSKIVTSTKVGVLCLKENVKKTMVNIGIVDGFTAWSLMDRVKSGKMKLVKKHKMKLLIKYLLDGKIDGIYGSADVLKFHALKMDKSGLFDFHTDVKMSVDEFFFSTHSSGNIINEFNQWLDKNQAFTKKLKGKYTLGL